MENPIAKFAESAKGLAKNPLGIIALFLGLVYGFAALVTTYGSGLTATERQPLVWFLIVFPCLVLGAFYRLVTTHHAKLYAPADFRDDQSFLKTLTPAEQRERLEKEAEALDAAEATTKETTDTGAARRQQEADQTGAGVESVQAVRSFKKSEIAVVESLVLRELQAEYGVPVIPNVKIERGGEQLWFDGAIHRPRPIGIEIVFARSLTRDRIDKIAILCDSAAAVGVRVIIAVVVLDKDAALGRAKVAELTERMVALDLVNMVDIKQFSAEKLRGKYGLDDLVTPTRTTSKIPTFPPTAE